MLQKLTPEQVARIWDNLSIEIEKAVDNYNPVNVLRMLLSQILDCWVYLVNDNLAGVITTGIITDTFTGRKLLMIYSFSSEGLPINAYDECLGILVNYAKNNHIAAIIGYANNDKIKRLAITRGFKCSNFLSKEI